MFRATGLLTVWLLCLPDAMAGVADAPGERLEIALLTYGPGAIYWERFGHNAIEIRDTVSGQAASFNYGVFDFDESGFLLNFARGYMHYMIDVAPSDADRKTYVDDGRSVTRQRLALAPAQAARLRDFLVRNLLPENVRYNYDYLTDNCSTRVRDALDGVLGGQLRAQLGGRRAGMTYREQIDRSMNAQPWLMLIMDLGLGPFADQPISAWQESFLPVVLQDALRDVRIDAGREVSRPLVSDEQTLAPNRLDPPPAAAPDLRLPLALAGLGVAALLVLTRRRSPTIGAILACLFLLFAGIAGLFMLGLWTLTMHRAAWENANLLLFSPIAFVFLRPQWRRRIGSPPMRLTRILVLAQLAAVLIAVLPHAAAGPTQQNQPWLLFALPVWSALTWCLLVNGAKAGGQPSA